MKGLATKYHISILSTVEYPKLAQGQVPTNNNIGESNQIAYDANLLCHIYNDIHEYGEKATHYHLGIDEDGTPMRMPRIHLDFGKNKITPYKGRQWYDFYPQYADLEYVESSIPEQIEENKQRPDKRFKEAIGDSLTE